MAAAMATGSCQGVQVVATCIVDSPLAASTSIAAAHFRQKAWFRAGAQSLCMNEWHPQARNGAIVTRALAAENSVPAVKEKYEVELDKPFGLKFYKGADGGTYIDAIAPGGSADRTELFTPGDKVVTTR